MGGAADEPELSIRKPFWTDKNPIGRSATAQGGIPTYDQTSTNLNPSEKTIAANGLQTGSSANSDNEKHHAIPDRIANSTASHASHSPQSEETETSDPAVKSNTKTKRSLNSRMIAGIKRFGIHTKDALFHSWVNIFLVFVPVGIIVKVIGLSPGLVFGINAIAIIPLAGLLVYATESVASRLGDTLGALLNVSFGNAVELILFIIALIKNEIRIVQASLLGSILSNLLLILGMAFLLGGLRFQEQVYNNTVTQMSACLLSLSVISLLLPTAFHASFSDAKDADVNTLKISRATSVVLLIIYVLYLLFQLKSHAYLYESTPQHIIDEESHPGILADVLDSSTSSDGSDSSTSDTDTSGSHITAKRIKRAFRHRRRRKSSGASSMHTTSVPSIISSPSVERVPIVHDNTALTFHIPSRRPSTMGGVTSGDEADVEHVGGRPRIRDFVDSINNDPGSKVHRKMSRKHSKKHRKHHLDKSVPEEGQPTRKVVKIAEQQNLPVESSPTTQPNAAQIPDASRDQAPKRGISFRQFQAPSLRPTLPKMLTQNVFVAPPPAGGAQPAPPPPQVAPIVTRTGAHVLRRTNSLPDRLNRQQNGQAVSRQPSGLPNVVDTNEGIVVEVDDDADDEEIMSRTAATVLLLVSTALVAVCAEFLVGAIPGMLADSSVSQEFIGLIVLPIVSNAAEHLTAVTVAAKNKMDLAIGVSVGSSIQISLFVTPFVVILGWIIGRDMTLYFSLFETVCLFVTVFVVNFLVLDGRSNYLEGSLLMAAYTIIAVSAFYFPASSSQSSISGGR